MNIVRYNPNSWFDTLPFNSMPFSGLPFTSLFDRLANDFLGLVPVETAKAETPVLAPRVDVRNNDKAIVLSAEIPGVDREGLKIEVKDGVLTLHGEKRREDSEESNGFYRCERVYGTFSRSFTLPEEVEGEGIEAAYKDGVLTITLPKKPEAAPRVIAIKNAAGEAETKEIGVN